jgi:UDP-N-acetylmuramate dehydrogenase
VSVGAGVVFDDFCAWAAKEGLWGVENLSYIPGEVGASAVQNIGAYGVEVKDVIRRVYCYDTVDEEFVNFDVEECEYGYRDSIFKDPEVKGRYIVTHVVFALSRVPQPKLEYGHLKDAFAEVASSSLTPDLIRKTIIKIRKEKLPEPSVKGSAGSFFKNPVISMADFQRIEASAKAELGADYMVPHYDLPDGTVKVPAAWMIEQCGWKGKRSGGAAVWDKQPLVIVNHTGDAYPEEIVGLEKRIIASVRTKFGVELSPEVEHV